MFATHGIWTISIDLTKASKVQIREGITHLNGLVRLLEDRQKKYSRATYCKPVIREEGASKHLKDLHCYQFHRKEAIWIIYDVMEYGNQHQYNQTFWKGFEDPEFKDWCKKYRLDLPSIEGTCRDINEILHGIKKQIEELKEALLK
jgi:hypothetical protein